MKCKDDKNEPDGLSVNFFTIPTNFLSSTVAGIFLTQSRTGLTNMLKFFNIDLLYFSSCVRFSKSLLETPCECDKT